MGTLLLREGKWKFERIGQTDTIVRGILIYTFVQQEDVLLKAKTMSCITKNHYAKLYTG